MNQKLEDNEIFITTTDTVIGIGGKVNEEVKNKIYKIKKRDFSKKLIIAIGSIQQLEKLENLTEIHFKYIEKYWPGNTTLIINNNAYRMPDNDLLLNFINEEGPFYLTSANISNESIIIDVEEAKKVFPNLKYFDFGRGSGSASQIIDTKDGRRIR